MSCELPKGSEIYSGYFNPQSALGNSFILEVSAATICAILCTIIVIAIRKARSKLGKVVEAMKLLPYTIQYVMSSFTQISGSLEAAAQLFGGSPLYIFRLVTLPLIMKGVLTVWTMTFIISFR